MKTNKQIVVFQKDILSELTKKEIQESGYILIEVEDITTFRYKVLIPNPFANSYKLFPTALKRIALLSGDKNNHVNQMLVDIANQIEEDLK